MTLEIAAMSAEKPGHDPLRINGDRLLIEGDANQHFIVVTDASTCGDESVPETDLADTVSQVCMMHLRRYGLFAADHEAELEESLVKIVEHRFKIDRTDADEKELRLCMFVACVATPQRLVVLGAGDCFVCVRKMDGTLEKRLRFRRELLGHSNWGKSIGVTVRRNGCFLFRGIESLSVDAYSIAYIGSDGAGNQVFRYYAIDPPYAEDIDSLVQWNDLKHHVMTYTHQAPRNDDTTLCRIKVVG